MSYFQRVYRVRSYHMTLFGWTFIYQSMPNGLKLNTDAGSGVTLIVSGSIRSWLFCVALDNVKLRDVLRAWD